MNLLSKLHKNSILTGPVDSYCLACSCLLRSEEETYAHINNHDHSVKRDALQTLDNFKDDQIIVIKNKEGYYCPFCNIILPTIKRVGLHVTEAKHQEIRESQSISRQNGVILAYDSLVISEKAWNGLDEDTCFVCNEDNFDKDHTTDKAHVLKLIQSKCEFGETFIYRKIDDDLFFCLICGDFHHNEEKPMHHDTENHLRHYNTSKQLATDLRNKKIADISEPNNNKVLTTEAKSEITQDFVRNKEANDKKPKLNENKSDTQTANGNITHNTESLEEKTVNTNRSHNTPKLNAETAKNPQVTPKLSAESPQVSQTASNKLSTQNVQISQTAYLNGNTRLIKLSSTNTEAQVAQNASKTKPDVGNAQNKTDKSAVNAKTESDKVPNDKSQEPHIYKFLKARNFVVLTYDGESYCTLCDCSIKTSINLHAQDKHHRVLYAKHMARKAMENTYNEPKANEDTKIQTEKPKTNDVTNGDSKPKEKDVTQNVENEKSSNKTLSKAPITKEAKETVIFTKEHKLFNTTVTQVNNNTQTKTAVAEQASKTMATKENGNYKESKAIVSEQTNNKTNTKTPFTEQINNKEIASKKVIKEKENIPTNIEKGQTDVVQDEKVVQKDVKPANKKNRKKAKVPVIAKEDLTQETTPPAVECEPNNKQVSAENEKNSAKVENVSESHNEESNYLKDEITRRNTEIQLENFTNVLKAVSQFDNVPDDLVVNGQYVLENLSFMLIVHEGTKYTCMACEGDMTHDQVYKHVSTDQHTDNVEASKLVTSYPDEFIRQLVTQKYHCGFCNIVAGDWTEMQSHLESFRHEDAKTSASWRLEQYHPHLRLCTKREVIIVSTHCSLIRKILDKRIGVEAVTEIS